MAAQKEQRGRCHGLGRQTVWLQHLELTLRQPRSDLSKGVPSRALGAFPIRVPRALGEVKSSGRSPGAPSIACRTIQSVLGGAAAFWQLSILMGKGCPFVPLPVL